MNLFLETHTIFTERPWLPEPPFPDSIRSDCIEKGAHMETRTKVLWAEKAEFPRGWGIKEHAHEYYHLFYFLEGEGVFLVNRQKFDALPGTCFIVPPNTSHELKKVEKELVVSYEIKFTIHDEYLETHLDLHNPMFPGSEFMETSIAYIVEHGRSRLPHTIQNTDCFLCALLTHLSKDDLTPATANSTLIDTTGFSDASIEMISYMEKNYMNPIRLDDIAGHIDYNRNYMCLLFKKDTGITIVDYLNYVRIRKACEFISYSDIDITQVCSRVGFANVSHFNRTFKKFVGISPGIFRRLFPVDISGNLGKDGNGASAVDSQILTIAEAIGTLYNSGQRDNVKVN